MATVLVLTGGLRVRQCMEIVLEACASKGVQPSRVCRANGSERIDMPHGTSLVFRNGRGLHPQATLIPSEVADMVGVL